MTKGVVEATSFRERWIGEFGEQARLSRVRPRASPWEGDHAYREFRDNDLVWLVLPEHEPDWLFDTLMSRLSKEATLYRLFERDIVPTNRSFKAAISAVRGAETRLRRTPIPDSGVSNGLQKTLEQHASKLEETHLSLESRKRTYWHDVLLAEPEERMRWYVHMDDKKQVHVDPPAEITEWERVFDRARYPSDLIKRIDLDTRFQVRVGVILRIHLFKAWNISLRTISRLTVLTYLCGELGQDDVDGLIVAERRITVSGVDQKLRSAGLK